LLTDLLNSINMNLIFNYLQSVSYHIFERTWELEALKRIYMEKFLLELLMKKISFVES
jgi:hypothetical protein